MMSKCSDLLIFYDVVIRFVIYRFNAIIDGCVWFYSKKVQDIKFQS